MSLEEETRLEQLKAMKSARMDMRGRAMPGFSTNVKMIDEEIARLEETIAAQAAGGGDARK